MYYDSGKGPGDSHSSTILGRSNLSEISFPACLVCILNPFESALETLKKSLKHRFSPKAKTG